MKRSIAALFISSLSMLLLAACSTLPYSGKLPDGLTVAKVTSVDKGSPFALSPDGSVVAKVSSGLKLYHTSFKEELLLGEGTPVKLAWSPHGYFLAAIFSEQDESRIVVYDQYGTPMADERVKASLMSVSWLSDDELIAGGTRVRSYKFGINYQSLFFRWKPGRDLPVENVLRDATLRQKTYSDWRATFERGPMVDLSSQSPVVLYLHPVDPPMFTPYYKLIMRDLESGKDLEVASVTFSSGGGRFSADGEKVLYGDGSGNTVLSNPWTGEVLRMKQTPGVNPALSPEGESWVSDGVFFRRDGSVVPIAEGAEAEFSRTGDMIMFRDGGNLYQISGIKQPYGIMFVPEVAEKVTKLRSKRFQGLMTPKEYGEEMQKVVAP